MNLRMLDCVAIKHFRIYDKVRCPNDKYTYTGCEDEVYIKA